MQKQAMILGLSLVFVFGLALQAAAFNIILDTDSLSYTIGDVNGHSVQEIYSARNVVNQNVIDSAAQDPFFDSDLVFNTKDSGKKNFEITWKITNNTGVIWTDYHLVLTDPNGAFFTGAQSADFQTAAFTNLREDFSGGSVAPGDVLHLNIALNLTNVSPGEVDLRQIATGTDPSPSATVPLPGAALLLGSGLAGLTAFRRWKKV